MSVLDVDTPSDDVEDVMHAVGDAMRAWEGQDMPTGARTQGQNAGEDVRHRAALLRQQWRIDGSAIIHSNRPRLGPWIIRMQSFVRRATWWFLEPIIQQIRLYQRNSARVIDGLAQEQGSVDGRLAEMAGFSRRVADLEDRLARLERRVEEAGGREDHGA